MTVPVYEPSGSDAGFAVIVSICGVFPVDGDTDSQDPPAGVATAAVAVKFKTPEVAVTLTGKLVTAGSSAGVERFT